MNNQIILGSLALDLRRAALGYHRGSLVMAERFYQEAMKRKQELSDTKIQSYLKILLDKLEMIHEQEDQSRRAEDYLLYSTLFQNAATTPLKV